MRRAAAILALAWKVSTAAWRASTTGQRWTVGIILSLGVCWVVGSREQAEFRRTHECHWETRERMERVSWLAGITDEWQSDPIVGPPPKYTKIGDRYYYMKTQQVEMCVPNAAPAPKDPICDWLTEKDAGGAPGFDKAAKYVKLEDGKDHWLWASYADYKKYGRCFPTEFGPDFVFYVPADKSEVAVCSAVVPFPPYRRKIAEAKAAGCDVVSYEDYLAIKVAFGSRGPKP
jgi:hypothetical protein